MLEFVNVKFGYNNYEILKNLSFNLKKGDFVALIGPNGAGKTTILKLILKKFKVWSGKIILEGKDICNYSQKEISKKIGIITDEGFKGENLKVEDFVSFGRYPYFGKPLYDKVVEEAMEFTDICGLKGRKIYALSSGEKQRVFLAKVLAQEPQLLLLDEPATHLDLYYQIEIFKLLEKLNKQRNIAILVISHNFWLIKKFVKKIFVLYKGEIKYEGKPQEIFKENIMKKVFRVSLREIYSCFEG